MRGDPWRVGIAYHARIQGWSTELLSSFLHHIPNPAASLLSYPTLANIVTNLDQAEWITNFTYRFVYGDWEEPEDIVGISLGSAIRFFCLGDWDVRVADDYLQAHIRGMR